jgi:uncharacterized protein YndB with AHSA1/START domain
MSTREQRQKAKVVIERSYEATLDEVWDLWTTKDGFESWWGPQGFRVEVQELDARVGGALLYDMIAATPEMVAAMKEMGQAASHKTTSRFTLLEPKKRLVITSAIDFLPGVATYESDILVDLEAIGDRVRMVVTLDAMHNEEFTKMQTEGFTSQLTKLDERFG